jgi:cell division protein FtsW
MWKTRRAEVGGTRRVQPPDRVIFWIAVGLLGFGAIMVFSASAPMAGENYNAPFFFFLKQVLFFLFGLALMVGVSHIPYTFWEQSYRYWLLGGVVLLLAVLFFPEVRGARRWISIGPLNLQVSEAFRFGVIVFMAAALGRRRRSETGFKKRVFPHIVLLAVGSMLIMLQPDLSAVAILSGTGFAILFFAGTPIKQLAALATPVAAAGAFLVFVLGYKLERLAYYLDGLKDPFAASYQVRQALIHMGHGGIGGAGLGGGMAKFHYVPDAHTDFILASAGEELGLVATVLIVTAYAVLLARGMRIAVRAPSRFAALLVAGLVATLGLQTMANISVVLGLVPPTGLPLPLLSYGGSSVLFTTVALAIILNVSRHVRG